MNKLKTIFTAALMAATISAAAGNQVSSSVTAYESGAVTSQTVASVTITKSAKSEWNLDLGIAKAYIPYYTTVGYYYPTTYLNYAEIDAGLIGISNSRDIGNGVTITGGVGVIISDVGTFPRATISINKEINNRLSVRAGGVASIGEDLTGSVGVGASLRLFGELYADISLGLSDDNSTSLGLTYKF